MLLGDMMKEIFILQRKSVKLFILLYFIIGSSWLFFTFDKIDLLILLIGSIYCYKLYKKENNIFIKVDKNELH
jgi:hypothetical protein